MASFMSSAAKKTTDVRAFIREAAGNNTLKYKPEAGNKHYIYIPSLAGITVNDDGTEVATRNLIAINGAVHDWVGSDGKYNSSMCLKDVFRLAPDGVTQLNDGTCPICDKVQDAWGIYRYRMDLEEKSCGKTGAALEEHLSTLKNSFADDRKAKDANPYMYILVVKYRTAANGEPILSANKLPEFDLKVMKLSASRAKKMQQQIENSGASFEGSELVFEYPKTDDPRLLVSQSTTALVYPTAQFINKYAGLREEIQSATERFTWDGIEKSFKEWAGMSVIEAEKEMEKQFEKWNEYQKLLAVSPQARYLEYSGANEASNPMLGAPSVAGLTPTAAPLFNVAPMAAPVGSFSIPGTYANPAETAPVMPTAAPVMQAAAPVAAPVAAPSFGTIPDVNAMMGAPNAPVQL